MKSIIILFLAVMLALPIFANAAISEWNYEAKMPMHAVYPRPDCETEKHARHRWAHTDMPYEIPIGVQGGAWPFTFILIEGPEGAKIGTDPSSKDYGVVSWTPNSDASGNSKFRVRVIDKAGNNLDISWSTTVDNSKFIFVKDGFTGEKKGTISHPLEDISDWYRYDIHDDTYHNKIIVFRSGDYKLIGGEDTNGNVRLKSDFKTPTLIGYPTERAVIDASEAKILTDKGKMTDLFIADLYWKDSRQDVNNAHFIWARGNVSRSTWWRNHFSNHGMGRKGNDNPAGVFVSGTRTHKKYIFYSDNYHDKFDNGRGNGSYVDIYYSSYVLIEGNYATNSDNKCGFWAKGTTSFVTIRDNHAFDNITSGGICVGYGKESPEIPHDHEVAWNRIVLNGKHPRANAIQFANQKSWEDKHYNSFIYRNTFVNGRTWIRFEGKTKYVVDANVIVSEFSLNESETKTYYPNLLGQQSDYITNGSGELTGFASDYHGMVGFERVPVGESE